MVMAVLKEAYPNFYANRSEEDLLPAIKLWQECFADDSYEVVMAAVKALIVSRTETFPPVIGEVKEKIRLVTEPEPMSEQEAWALVSKACSDSIWHSEEQFAKLPPEVQAAVGSPKQLKAWGMMDIQTFESVVASNFMRTFRSKQKHRNNIAALPTDVKRVMLDLTKSFALPERLEESN
jgi:hypothetical protein